MRNLKKEITAGCGLSGRYRITVRRPSAANPSGDIVRQLEFDNLITNNGLDGIGTNGASWVTAIGVGTGTSVPSNSDTALSAAIETTTTIGDTGGTQIASSPRYGWWRWTKRFAQGVAQGNWTEVGIGRSKTNLWSRALILDGLDVPTTLSIASIDILDIEYELRAYLTETDITGNRTIGGVDTAYVIRALNTSANGPQRMLTGSWMSAGIGGYGVQHYTGALNAIWVTPGGTGNSNYNNGDGPAVPTIAAYSNGTYKKVMTYSYSISGGNAAGGYPTCVMYVVGDSWNGGWNPYKCSFSPPIDKTNTKVMTLTWSFTWGRY